MSNIAFIGLGNMGGPMAGNLVKAGHTVRGADLVAENRERAVARGIEVAADTAAAIDGVEVVCSCLPNGPVVRKVYLGEGGVLAKLKPGTVVIDASTIDVDSARAVHAEAEARGIHFVDAPMSGGTGGAEAGTLTFMVGGPDAAVAAARPYLEAMGKTVVHAGGPGTGQAAKICNNMILGISMIGVSEAFVLAEKLGLDHQKLFDISSKASGRCWSLDTYCPVPGPVPASPANRDYTPGFSAAMMLKDLRLAQEAAQSSGASTPLGAEAAQIYGIFDAMGGGDIDFSGIIRFLRGEPPRT